MSKRPDIQGLRAIAVVMVVAFHAGLPVPGGFSGVDVFFVVSGFVIGRLLLREIETTGRIDLARFATSRIKRLVPALTVMLFATILAANLLTFGDRTSDIVTSAIASALMASNFFFVSSTGGYFDVADGEVPLLHTWTLSAEAQFYLAVPFALVAAWWLAGRLPFGRRRSLLAITTVAALASLALAALLVGGHTIGGVISDPPTFAFYGSFTRAWEFLAGTLIAIAEARLLATRRRRLATAVAGVGLAAVVASALLAGKTGPVPTTGVFLPVVGAALLIGGLTAAQDGPLNRLLGLRPLTVLGDLSYSWYLWHWPFIVFAAIAAPERELAVPAAVLALIPSWLSYRYVESRVRNRAGLAGWKVARLGVACVAFLAVAGVALTAGQRAIVDRAGIGNLERALSQSALVESGACLTDGGKRWTPMEEGVAHCLPRAQASAPRILLVGDSQADAYGYAVRAIAERLGMRLDAVTGGSCLAAPVRLADGRRASSSEDCDGIPAKVAASIKADPPALLILAQARNSVVLDPTADGRTGTAAQLAELRARYVTALEELTRPVTAGGGNVLFALTVPKADADGSTCGTVIRALTGTLASCLSAPRTDAETTFRAFPIWAGATTMTERHPRMQRFDPSDLFCDASRCSQVRKGRLAYRNGDHLSVDGAMDLVPELGAAVDRALAARPKPTS